MINFTLPKEKDYSFKRDGITQSMIGTYLACRRRACLQLNRWTTPGTVDNVRFGDMCHTVLEKVYKAFGKKGIGPTKSFVNKQIADYVKEYRKDFPSVNRDLISREEILAQAVLHEYIKYYKKDFAEKRFEEVEQVFDVKFQGYRLRGKRDGGFLDKNKGLWIMEHKFKGQIPDEMARDLQLEFQPRFYLLAWFLEKQKFPKGILYNVIRKPQHKQRENETAQEFYLRIRGIIQDDPQHFFYRYEIIYTKEEISEFSNELLSQLREYEKFCKGEIEIFHNPFSCAKPWPCGYQTACSTGRLTGYKQDGELFSELKEDE